MTVIILDNIRSAHNVGSIFRTAAFFGIKEIYLCGETPTPIDKYGRARSDIAKVALGAEKFVYWKYFSSSIYAIRSLKKRGIKILSIEQDKNAEDIGDIRFHKKTDVALVFGNEVIGISPKILKISDGIFEIPAFGPKESLNVSVACGVAVYALVGSKRKK